VLRRAWVLVALIAGCGEPHWSLAASNLDRVPLSLWAASPSDVWAVGGALGSGGQALVTHFDGNAWTETPTGTMATLWWVHGFSSSDLWMVGEQGLVLHWNGSTLSPSTSGTDRTLYGVWGTSDSNLWAVGGRPGQDGVILHYDGNAWSSVTVPVQFVTYFKVWGTGAADVFACGEGGTVVHFDGNAWSKMDTGQPPSTTLFTINGRAPNDVYTVGGLGIGVALHFDGASWSPLADPALAQVGGLAGVSEAADGTVMIVGAGGTKLHGLPGRLVDDSAEAPHDDLHVAFFTGSTAFVAGGSYQAPAGALRTGVIARFGD
jgi:hypothetical protein